VVDCLPSKHKTLNSNTNTVKREKRKEDRCSEKLPWVTWLENGRAQSWESEHSSSTELGDLGLVT
jgi:hypothetical protein